MEIRALTGFNETTRRRYGRSYSPLNGISLGNPREAGDFSDIPTEEQARPDIQETTEQKNPKDSKKYIKPILIATALGGLFYVLKKKKII
mgnify:CR=1 FL=1|tara:strand:+ start:753 stop:1022 length:270 start_codon:yes stop_codon:yes gene_type:complete